MILFSILVFQVFRIGFINSSAFLSSLVIHLSYAYESATLKEIKMSCRAHFDTHWGQCSERCPLLAVLLLFTLITLGPLKISNRNTTAITLFFWSWIFSSLFILDKWGNCCWENLITFLGGWIYKPELTYSYNKIFILE